VASQGVAFESGWQIKLEVNYVSVMEIFVLNSIGDEISLSAN